MYRWLTPFVFCVGFLAVNHSVLAAPVAPGSFSTTWQTDNPGASNSDQIRFVLGGDGDEGTCGGSYYWEEVGNDTNNGTSTLDENCSLEIITFPAAGTYRLDITGTGGFPTFDTSGDEEKILTVEQWGDNGWQRMNSMFADAVNLTIPAVDAPDLSSVTNMGRMFNGATSFNESINHWDVSNVTYMVQMFEYAAAFNQPLNNWDVSSVTDMRGMFTGATAFNQPLDSWDTLNMLDMSSMFEEATSFNQPLNNWDVSSVINLGGMFVNASSFNQPLNNWDVSSVDAMNYMFNGATAFDQDISAWDVSNVTTMTDMFVDSNLSTLNYSAILTSWSTLPSLQSDVDLDADASYCSTVQAARDILTTTYTWVISDGGSTNCFTLNYAPGTNATLVGVGSQTVEDGTDGSAVEVIPDAGYQFIQWSDGRTDNPRTDTGVTANVNVTAVITTLGSSGNTQATRVGDRLKNELPSTTTTSTTPVVTKETFFASIKKLITYLQMNEAELAQLSPEESSKVIIGLRDILVYLLSLLPSYE